jgi:radical SAM superfamily enzyme YgiQ (UPF0313 family)
MGMIDRNSIFKIPKLADKNKVLLVALNAEKFPFFGESHGICSISGYLKATFPNIQVKTFDLQLNVFSEIIDFIEQEKPALLGISVKLLTFDHLLTFISRLKSHIHIDKRPIIIVGNSVPNFNGQLILEKYLSDIIVGIGEGELIMGDMFRFVQGEIPFNKVRNIHYRNNGKIKYSKQEYLEGIDIKLPDRSNSKTFYNLGAEVYIEGSRGCAHCNCTICACNEFLGSKIKAKKWRPRPVNLIVEDMRILKNMGIENVTFADEDCFGFDNSDMSRVKHLAESLISNKLNINFRMSARVKTLYSKTDSARNTLEKLETFKLLRKAGLVKIFVGLESGSETQLKRYRKGFTLDEFTKAYELLKKSNIECEFGLILLDPLMNLEELKDSLSFLETNGYVYEISSICKELRVQIGNSYVDQVKDVEKTTGVKILGEFDFNYQAYRIIRYLDEDIQFFATYIREWVEIGTKVYNVLRLFTRYSEQEEKNIGSQKFEREICFVTIKKLRTAEFSLLNDFVALIEQKGRDFTAAYELILNYELIRRAAVSNLNLILVPCSDLTEIRELYKEAVGYVNTSQQYSKRLIQSINEQKSLRQILPKSINPTMGKGTNE